jgi:hypothetical protein
VAVRARSPVAVEAVEVTPHERGSSPGHGVAALIRALELLVFTELLHLLAASSQSIGDARCSHRDGKRENCGRPVTTQSPHTSSISSFVGTMGRHVS